MAKHKSLLGWVYLKFSRGDLECSWRRYFETNVIIPVIFKYLLQAAGDPFSYGPGPRIGYFGWKMWT